MSNSRLSIPSVSELLESPPLKSLVNRVSHNVVVTGVRQFLDDMRSQVQSAAASVPAPADLAQRIADWISADQPRAIAPIVNATGILINEELGGVPIADEAIQAMTAVARGYVNAETNLATGARCDADREVEGLLLGQTGLEAAAVVHSQAAALWVSLASLATGKEMIVSRGQLIESANGSRLHDILEASRAVVRSVGTVNKTRADDYTSAIRPESAALLHVTSNPFSSIGGGDHARLNELVSIGRRNNLSVVEWIENCSWTDLTQYGITGQPLLSQSVGDGADLIILSGQRLLGGPPCGIILGRRALIQMIKSHPLTSSLRADMMTFAALAATLRLYQDHDLAERAIPLLSLIATPLENLRLRAERLAPQIVATGIASVEIVASQSSLSTNARTDGDLPSVSLALKPTIGSVEQLARALFTGAPPVVGRIHDGSVLLNLRSVLPRDDLALIAAIEAQRSGSGAASPSVPLA